MNIRNIIELSHWEKPIAVIFDWDNTLISSRIVLHKVLYAVAEELSMDKNLLKSSKLFSDSYNLPVLDAFPEIFGDRAQEAIESYIRNFRLLHLNKGYAELRDGVHSILETLKRDGVIMFIVSNKENYFLKSEVVAFGIADYFHSIIGAGDAERNKPDPAPVQLALNGTGLNPYNDNIWFIGDSTVDMECGINSGCVPILLGEISQDTAATLSSNDKFLNILHADSLKSLVKIYNSNKFM